jgi:DNA-binding NarL/FixJ family response regulator
MSTSTAARADSPIDGLLLTRDLLFTSKVTGTAAALGWRVETVATLEALRTEVERSAPLAIFVDLAAPDIDLSAVVACADVPRPAIIGFGSHVDVNRLESARQAGFDDVMPRSKFSSSLPQILQQVFKRSPELGSQG